MKPVFCVSGKRLGTISLRRTLLSSSLEVFLCIRMRWCRHRFWWKQRAKRTCTHVQGHFSENSCVFFPRFVPSLPLLKNWNEMLPHSYAPVSLAIFFSNETQATIMNKTFQLNTKQDEWDSKKKRKQCKAKGIWSWNLQNNTLAWWIWAKFVRLLMDLFMPFDQFQSY